MERIADSRPAGPVGDGSRDMRERCIRAALTQLSRDAGETRAEREGLDAAPPPRERVRHMKKKTRVGLHRSGDVAQDDERPALDPTRTANERDRLALRGE